jgi:hypothetical protein
MSILRCCDLLLLTFLMVDEVVEVGGNHYELRVHGVKANVIPSADVYCILKVAKCL